MLTDSGTKLILTQEKLKARLEALMPAETQIITLEDAKKFKQSNIKFFLFQPQSTIAGNHLAYIIYTSGSTGKPKGVMIEHHSIVNQMLWLKDTFNLNEQTTILQKTPMSFDAAQWEILAPSCGSRVIMGRPGIYKDPEQLIKTIQKHKVTALQCVPTLLQALLDTDGFTECKTLKQIFSGGEALTKSLALECLNSLPGCQLVNLYGPTECTINTSAFIADISNIQKSVHTISIGKPIMNCEYHILDELQKPVAAGDTGELYISGEGLARGYLNRPELTAEKFISISAHKGKSIRAYKTGDLAYWNMDGTVQYMGRADNQVKLRGFRVELDEIKTAIEAHDWIKHSAKDYCQNTVMLHQAHYMQHRCI